METTEPPKLVPDYPRTWPAVLGYILVHPRTWCIVLALAFSWQCFGLKEYFHRHNITAESAVESESFASTSHH